MRRVLMYAIPIVMAVGLLAAVANNPEDGQKLAAGGETPDLEQGGEVTGTTLPAVIESPPVTVPVTAPPVVVEETTTTTVPAPTPTTMAKPKPKPRPAAAPRPVQAPRPAQPAAPAPQPEPAPVVQQPEPIDCGTGSASARSRLVNDAGTYRLVATVTNESTKDIQLDSLMVRATYASGPRTFTVNVGGRVIEARPGQFEMSFDIPESAGAAAPSTFEISEFRFHTAGLPECSSQ
jgi:outer membrane biosynthesis protein TonB